MNPIAIAIGLILLGGATAFVIKPFQAGSRLTPKKTRTSLSAGEAHTAALTALRDLDFDFRTGKVSEEDYSGLRTQLVAEAAKYVETADHENDQLEALIRTRKQALARVKPCPKCGEKLDEETRFCPHCGTDVGLCCPACGKKVKSGDMYCRACGSKLELQAEATA